MRSLLVVVGGISGEWCSSSVLPLIWVGSLRLWLLLPMPLLRFFFVDFGASFSRVRCCARRFADAPSQRAGALGGCVSR